MGLSGLMLVPGRAPRRDAEQQLGAVEKRAARQDGLAHVGGEVDRVANHAEL